MKLKSQCAEAKRCQFRAPMYLVWSVALYAADMWTLMQADRSRLEASEMWMWRRMENKNKMRKFFARSKWMGHVLRHDGILCDILEGRMLGRSTSCGARHNKPRPLLPPTE